jgi:CRISPR/Cas system CSM-associated protein Csm4 (group 5 of RAMP superfamily)
MSQNLIAWLKRSKIFLLQISKSNQTQIFITHSMLNKIITKCRIYNCNFLKINTKVDIPFILKINHSSTINSKLVSSLNKWWTKVIII